MDNMATELLHELKASSRRWFIAFTVMVVLEIATVAGFIWYISLPVEETTTTEVMQDNEGDSNTMIGIDYGKTDGEDNTN